MPKLSKRADEGFPALNRSRTMPIGLARIVRQIAGQEAHKRYTPGHWLHQFASNPPHGSDVKDIATFIWSLAGIRQWLRSEERHEQYELASERVHRLPPGLEPKRSVVAHTVDLYSVRGGQRLEGLTALGFAFACGRKTHSLKLWRPFFSPIYEFGLGKPMSFLRDEDEEKVIDSAVEKHFGKLRSRLNTAIADIGENQVNGRARDLFADLRYVAFPTYATKL